LNNTFQLYRLFQIHSRKSQSQRNATADKFRKGTRMILFSSDVSARGVDYPDVTLVVQVRSNLSPSFFL
jgi:ATP-dependent RNA helicase MSS116